MINLVKDLIRADRTGNWELHISTDIKLQPLFHVFDRTNYARWSSVYIADIINLKNTNPQIYKAFTEAYFTVKKSMTRFTSIAVNQGLECSINHSSKDSGGVIVSTAQKGYVTTWNLVYHEELDVKNLFRKLTFVNEDNIEKYYHIFSHACTLQSEVLVSNIVNYIEKFTNPFLLEENSSLRNIISQEKVNDKICNDLAKLWNVGCVNFEKFFSDRLLLKKEPLSHFIKKFQLNTMDVKVASIKK